jgi:hypothetical protein
MTFGYLAARDMAGLKLSEGGWPFGDMAPSSREVCCYPNNGHSAGQP